MRKDSDPLDEEMRAKGKTGITHIPGTRGPVAGSRNTQSSGSGTRPLSPFDEKGYSLGFASRIVLIAPIPANGGRGHPTLGICDR